MAIGEQVDAAINKDIAYNVDAGRQGADQASTDYRSGFGISSATRLSASSPRRGILTIRAIAKPIQDMTAAMHRLAAKDMTAGDPRSGRGDRLARWQPRSRSSRRA